MLTHYHNVERKEKNKKKITPHPPIFQKKKKVLEQAFLIKLLFSIVQGVQYVDLLVDK